VLVRDSFLKLIDSVLNAVPVFTQKRKGDIREERNLF